MKTKGRKEERRKKEHQSWSSEIYLVGKKRGGIG